MNDIQLNFYTSDASVYEYAPTLLSRSKPEWWHNTPLTYTFPHVYGDMPKATIRTCDGFNQFHNNGFTICIPEDMMFEVGETYLDGLTCSFDQIEVHNVEQRGTYLPPDRYQHIKILYPWFIECEEDVKFAYIGNTWSLDDPECFIVPPAVIDYKTQYAGHINVFIPYTGVKRKFTIKAGTPIVAVIPLSERKLKIASKLISEHEFDELIKNSDHYERMEKRHIKKMEKHFGCPFHQIIGMKK